MKKKIFLNIWEIENSFYQKSDISRLNKAICHYEIFKKTLNTPGAIIECGVFKGTSLIRFLTFRNLLKKNHKKVIGFDPFGKFPKQRIKEDQIFARNHDKHSGLGIKKNKLQFYLKRKKFSNFKLIKGNIENSLPHFLRKNKNLKVSFLHLDMDVYEPTKYALNFFYKYMSKKGIILIDDYGQVKGATRATREFLKKFKSLKIQQLKFNSRLKFLVKN